MIKYILIIHDILAQRNRYVDFTITSNKGPLDLMNINGIMITKQFISQYNFKRLRGSVGRAHVHVGYIFFNSNEEIVVSNSKIKDFFLIYILFCLVCCV